MSFVTVGELLFGARKRKWGPARQDELSEKLRSVVIVPYDLAVCRAYGETKAVLQEQGIGIADNDLWIASCAIRHSIPLVSNNRKHFERIPNLVLISEAPAVERMEAQTRMDLGE